MGAVSPPGGAVGQVFYQEPDMTHENRTEHGNPTRREFLARSAGLTIGLMGAAHLAARGSIVDELKIGIVGCGGRGTGAVIDALGTSGPIRLVAMGDVFADRLQSSFQRLKSNKEIGARVEVPENRRFVGFDAYQRVLASDIDVVLLTTPPAFRPLHYAAAIAAGRHVFMEKPCCVDAPGYRSVMATNKIADAKNLKVVVGLQRRHQKSYLAGIKRVHGGEVGDIILIRTYFNMPGQGPNYDCRPAAMSELEWQIRHWGMFTWLSGDHIVEQAVHEIDIGNWMKKDAPPAKANGMGGRHVRVGCGNGQIFDHHFVEYEYADGSRHYAQAKQQPRGWRHVSDNVHGTKGVLTIGSGPYGMGGDADYNKPADRGTSGQPQENPYRQEHQDLVDAIRRGTRLNDGYHGATSSMTAVLGRMATYSGEEITWQQAIDSGVELAPGLADYTASSTPPVLPDQKGEYPIAGAPTIKS
jgi:myo-inositol 2-dehydrogenase / D-chiro-inositol 1-dehydrogenase